MREAENCVAVYKILRVQDRGLWKTTSAGECRGEEEECLRTVVKKHQEREKVKERAERAERVKERNNE